MRLTVVVERPTQFDLPLFRLAALDNDHQLRVLFTDPAAGVARLDPELGRAVLWDANPLSGYDCAVVPAHNASTWLRAQLKARRDLVIVNGYTRRPYVVAAVAARRAGSPRALRLDSVLFDEGPRIRRTVKRIAFRTLIRRLFDLFLGVGSLTLEYLTDLGIPSERQGLFPYPVDDGTLRRQATARSSASWRNRMAITPGAPIVLAVSKLHPRETPWDLLRAWTSVARPNRWLVLAGDGPDRSAVESFVRDHQLPRIVLLGYVPYAELPSLLRTADVFVHAPKVERWGVTVAEALACGTPVVASDHVGAVRDLVVERVNGFSYARDDRAALSPAIEAALALDRARVDSSSRDVLARWNLSATWHSLLDAAARLRIP